MGVIRQGDVALVSVRAIPKDAIEQPIAGSKLILALGEATGHHHRFEFLDQTQNVKLYVAHGGARYLEVKEGSFFTKDIVSKIVGKDGTPFVLGDEKIPGQPLKHEEHTAVAVPPGNWLLPQQVEYSPAELRRVAD